MKKTVSAGLMLVIIATTFAGCNWFGEQPATTTTTEEKTPVTVETPTVPETPVVDKLSGWKTYTLDKVGGFTMKYPSDWAINEGNIQSADFKHLEKGARFSLWTDPMPETGFEYLSTEIDKTEITLGDTKMNKIHLSDEENTIHAFIMKFSRNNHYYWFMYEFNEADNSAKYAEYTKLFDDMISTFKFTEFTACGEFPRWTGDADAMRNRYYVCQDKETNECYYTKFYASQIKGCDPKITDDNPYGNPECFEQLIDTYKTDGTAIENGAKAKYDSLFNCEESNSTFFGSKVQEAK